MILILDGEIESFGDLWLIRYFGVGENLTQVQA